MMLAWETLPALDELAIILAAIALGAFVKGVTGSGLPQIAIPVIAIFLGVERAVVIMALPGVFTNSWLMWEHRAAAPQTRDLPTLLVTGIVGAVIGTVGLTMLRPAILSLALAAVGSLYIVLFLTKNDLRLSPRVTRIASGPVGLIAGVLQGSTGVSGPILTTYLHAYRLERAAFIFSMTTLFNILAVAQVITLLRVGLYTPARLIESLLALLPMLVFLRLGSRFASRLSQQRFDLVLLALIGASVLLLVQGALGDLLGR
jgi:uncharacterized membrane protein YfcA